MSADSMLDSNVVVYTMDTKHREKTRRAQQLVQSGLRIGDCCISRQVVRETLNVATKKLGYTKETANRLLEKTLLPLHRPLDAPTLYRRGLEIRYRYQYDFYDSMIIAAALELGCETLYSEDLQHGQKIDQLTIEDPFRRQQ